MIEKIRNSIKNKTFKTKVVCKLNTRKGFFIIRNRGISRIESRDKVYLKMKKKYADIIQKGVEPTHSSTNDNSENIWMLWLQGDENAPKIVKACINSVRRNLPDKRLIILTENNLERYISFPDYIIEKKNKGIISRTHFSDLVRLEVLCKHGGLWIDATCLCTSSCKIIKNLFELPLFVFKRFDMDSSDWNAAVCSNWLIQAFPNQEILLLTQKLLYEYWRDYNYLMEYFIFHIMFSLAAERYKEKWDAVPSFNNCAPHTLQFELKDKYSAIRWKQLLSMSDFHKLTYVSKIEDSDIFTYYDYIIKEYGSQEKKIALLK